MPDAIGIPPRPEFYETGRRVRNAFNPSESCSCDSQGWQESGQHSRNHFVPGIREKAGDCHSDYVPIQPALGSTQRRDYLAAIIGHSRILYNSPLLAFGRTDTNKVRGCVYCPMAKGFGQTSISRAIAAAPARVTRNETRRPDRQGENPFPFSCLLVPSLEQDL